MEHVFTIIEDSELQLYYFNFTLNINVSIAILKIEINAFSTKLRSGGI